MWARAIGFLGFIGCFGLNLLTVWGRESSFKITFIRNNHMHRTKAPNHSWRVRKLSQIVGLLLGVGFITVSARAQLFVTVTAVPEPRDVIPVVGVGLLMTVILRRGIVGRRVCWVRRLLAKAIAPQSTSGRMRNNATFAWCLRGAVSPSSPSSIEIAKFY